MPPNPPSKAHGFAMRSMSLRDMQFSKSKKKILAPPCQFLGTPLIPTMWKLANIIPIPKPNKDTNMGTSYRPISLLSVVAKTLEKCLLPYITANITQTPTQHGYKAQHSTVTALYTRLTTLSQRGSTKWLPLRELSL